MDNPAKEEREEARADALRALMVRYQAGEIEAFERLYEMLVPGIRGMLRRRRLTFGAELEDLTQETFLQIHRSRHTYSPGRPVEPWAFAIARHVYLMDRRHRQRKTSPDVSLSRPEEDFEPRPEVREAPTEERAALSRDSVDRALSATTGRRRLSVMLHHVWGYTFREIGKMLGVRPDTAKRRASRGVADLRKALREDEENEEAP